MIRLIVEVEDGSMAYDVAMLQNAIMCLKRVRTCYLETSKEVIKVVVYRGASGKTVYDEATDRP